MSNGKDEKPMGPFSGLPGSGTPAGQPKRPSPIIDLEAKVIETRDMPGTAKPADPPATPKPVDDQSAASDKSGPEVPSGMPADTTVKTDSASLGAGAKPGVPPFAEPSKTATGATAAASKPAADGSAKGAPPPAPSGGGVGRFLGHLASGAAGAVLALFGAEYAASSLGIGLPTPNAGLLEDYGNRIGTLEQQVRENAIDAADSDVRARLKVIKSEIEALQATAKSVGTLQSQQQLLADKTADLEQKLGGAASGGVGERLARLEQTLATLSKTGTGDNAGKIPQIANLLTQIEALESRVDDKLTGLTAKVATATSTVELDTLKATGQQLGEDLASVKANAGKIGQDITTLEAGTAQIRKDIAALRQDTQSLKSGLEGQIGALVKSEQLAALESQIGTLKSELASVVSRDQAREAGANRILLSLELANLKRAIERGGGFAHELAQLRGLAPAELDLTALEAHAKDGLPPDQELEREFREIAKAAIAAELAPSADSSVLDRLWASARSVVQVRKTGNVEGTTAEAVIARMEDRLRSGDLEGALQESQTLSGDARAAAEPWLGKLAARLQVDRAIAGIDDGLKKLMGAAPAN